MVLGGRSLFWPLFWPLYRPLLRSMALVPFLLLTLSSAAQAQNPNPITRDELEGRALPKADQRGGQLTVDGGLELAPCPLADPAYADVKVTFSQVEFANLRGLAAASLDDSWREFVGQSLPVATICTIRDRAATILRKAGYLAAVQALPQRIAPNGVLKFDVLMAKLVRVQVRGKAGASEKLIASMLEPLTRQDVFNVGAAERTILLARDIPGYDVRLTLRPAGTAVGEVIGEVSVTYRRFELEANIQNLAGPEIGRWGGLIGAKFNGLTGLGDQTSISIYNTADISRQTILQAGHSFLLGGSGVRLAADFTYAWTSPKLNPPAPIKSTTLIFGINASYPLIRSQNSNLILTGGLELIDQDTRFGAVPLTKDKLRIAYARLDFDETDATSATSRTGYSAAEPRWRIGGLAELRQGLSALGASRACGAGFINCLPPFTPLSRAEANPSAFVARAQAYGELRPVPDITFTTRLRGQYALHALSSFEEFTAGNYTIGRGYEAGTLQGDSGLGVQLEMRVLKLQPKSRDAIALQPYVFFDAARVWNRDILSQPYAAGRSDLASAGGGVRAAWGNRARLDLGLAVPLVAAGLLTGKGDVRVLMSLIVKLFPWGP